MTKNPLINALLAVLYITLVSSLMFFGTKHNFGQDTVLAPIAMISLFTFSAATMGYLFLYQPFILYFDNKRKLALDLFLKTLLIFGTITGLIFALLFVGIF